ncbi:coiled-coil domain-containing protein 73-like [Takifugu flavidus]|uniref:coiled-coil domain-containing protein 73-like n=1 Tax=Takifugu flavidus TaxID=433684 RepID=UPI00254419BA|nr:coiled-coil domain-containing protein 73-like [Takifugu flavidus]XP_056908408.1 coiled-coil domain-containing protein 73-like [Takifugu flavidus]XP_056908409.1 coiled-coil domain-containing protein 73-like [Takifugu flavidus]XP_056908410.1 coiled-coil domain-containing protein 73-like [Takifugu flavidus]
MDTSAESLMSNTLTGVGGSAPDPDPSRPLDCGQSNRDSAILLQMLDFKTHLQEAVEELHARRDAAARFEEQMGELVTENRELEWAKERLQHQRETVAKQHAESVDSVEKKFQAKMKSIEEEKGKCEASVEIKDKEINSLKAELKSAQLLKVNLEKRISGLEQTLLLQSRSKENQLRKLGEVEKRFGILSRQCAAFKQAHEELEQSVDEAVSRNVQLAAANARQEQLITSLTKETKMMKTLVEENAAVRREKLEVVRALQHTQQLLLSQTQAVSRAELELRTEAEQHQALKQEHEVMRERSKTLEDKLAQLTEECAACQRGRDKEKEELLGHSKRAPEDLQTQETENQLTRVAGGRSEDVKNAGRNGPARNNPE